MRVRSCLDDWPAARVREALAGLPRARGYTVVVKPLRYRTRPSLQAICFFDRREIIIRVPEPFRAFTLPIYIGARRLPGRKMRFRWIARKVTFRSRREVIRFLYCHEFFHWYLWEVMGCKSAAETACDRYALMNFRQRVHITHPDELPFRSGPRRAGKRRAAA